MGRARWGAVGTAVSVLVMSWWLLPARSDGAAAVSDGLWYGWQAEHEPRVGLSGHHPLFHGLAAGMVGPLEWMGIREAGHVAVRMLSGLGAAAVVLMVGLGSGRWLGVALALGVLAGRGFVFEAACGETILPACAAWVGALLVAGSRRARPGALGTLVAVALLLRQDSVLAVPGIAMAAAMAWPEEARARALGRALGGAAAVAGVGFVAAWGWADTDAGLVDYLFALARDGSWTEGGGATVANARLEGVALGIAAVGVQTWTPGAHLAVGIAALCLPVVAGVMGRGHGGAAVVVGAVGILALRFGFFLWFEAINHEWQVPTLALGGVMGAALCRGGVAGGRIASGLVALGAVAMLGLHGPTLVELRETRLQDAAEGAAAFGGPGCRFVAYGKRAATALHLAGVPQEQIDGDHAAAMQRMAEMLAARPEPTVLFLDRFARDGMPRSRGGKGDPLGFLDAGPDPEGTVALRREGRVVALGWRLPRGR